MEVTSHKGMTPAAEHVVDQATKRAAEILQDTDRVAHRLARYYARRGNYAGSTFLDLNPNNPLVIEASDLFATTLLSVQIPPMAARNILEPGATSMYLTRLLNQDELAVDINLAVSTDATLAAMRELHVALKQALSPHNVSQSNRWVTASKLSARKRPDLFPVRDELVKRLLGLWDFGNFEVDWQVYRHLLRNKALMDKLRDAVDAAATTEGVRVGDPNALLRHLDVALWTHAKPPRGT